MVSDPTPTILIIGRHFSEPAPSEMNGPGSGLPQEPGTGRLPRRRLFDRHCDGALRHRNPGDGCTERRERSSPTNEGRPILEVIVPASIMTMFSMPIHAAASRRRRRAFRLRA